MKAKLILRVKDGKPAEPGKVERFIDRLCEAHPNSTFIIEAEMRKSKRSLSQNAYYWAVVLPFMQEQFRETGSRFTIDKLHEIFKYKFLGTKKLVDPTTGEIITTIKGTSGLNKSEFSDFIEEIRILCLEYFGEDLPEAR